MRATKSWGKRAFSDSLLALKVENDEAIAQFTMLLQFSIYMDAPQGCSIGETLCFLPGFTEEYVSIRTKLFYLIAKACGKEHLSAGCVIKASALLKFLLYLEQVIGESICTESDTEERDASQLSEFLKSQTNIHLFITKKQ